MNLLLLLSKQPSLAADHLLNTALTQAGLRRQDVTVAVATGDQPAGITGADVEAGSAYIDGVLGRRRVNCVVALGNQAANVAVPGWPNHWDSPSQRRGYIWEGYGGRKVLTTLGLEDCLQRSDPSGVNAMLLAADLERAKNESVSPEISRVRRTVRVVSSAADAAAAAAVIRAAGYATCDIECYDSERLQCIGFAASTTEAYVFIGDGVEAALGLVADGSVRKVFQNGQFDAYFLATRCGVEVAGWTDDCMIAWHALWPEIAGKGSRGSKRTKKSLAFLASLYTDCPEWWKEYDGASDAEMYELNGRDCCITLEISQRLLREVAAEGVTEIYQHEMAMMPVLVAIQQRGLAVDENSRVAALETLRTREAATTEAIRAIAEPLLREHRDRIAKPHLFFGKVRCSCCNGGKSKALACWSCAGMDKAPGKKAAAGLGVCVPCGGAGSFETFEFNPASTQQQIELFYNVLRLPPRYNEGKPTVDEKALKNILGGLG